MLPSRFPRRMKHMNKQLKFLASLLIVAMAAAFAGSGQEINATMDATMNNTASNSTMIEAAVGAENSTAQESMNKSAINLSAVKGEVKNLSTFDNQSIKVAPISQMALAAPLVAAGASSIQTPATEEDSYKMGTVVNDLNQTISDPTEREPLSLGLPTKPVRDTGKMFFVCDLV